MAIHEGQYGPPHCHMSWKCKGIVSFGGERSQTAVQRAAPGDIMMTFRKKRHFCLHLVLTLVLALLALSALAQTQFSGQITSNIVGSSATLANPV
jgi:hypothetical protein